jgi:hypothetical protein
MQPSFPDIGVDTDTLEIKRNLGGAPILQGHGLKYGGSEYEGWRDGDLNGRRRLGKLHDSVYGSWDGYLSAAGQKMGVDLVTLVHQGSECKTEEETRSALERRLEVFQVLRCLLGPAVEVRASTSFAKG